MLGLKWKNVRAGISQIILVPMGHCTCGYSDVPENSSALAYFTAGSITTSHKADSLFDAEAIENQGKRRKYNVSWDNHMNRYTESTLLDKSAAIAVDLVTELTLPEDMTSEQLSDMGSDYEYSNVSLKTLLRIVVGPLKFRICAGLVHRLNCILTVASSYEYLPYFTPKPNLTKQELLPPSADDFDALNENISMNVMQFTVLAPIIEFHLFDHPHFQSTKEHLFRKRKKLSTVIPPAQSYSYMPKFTLEIQCIDARISRPIYTKRLVHTVCQLPDPPQHMFDACYAQISVKLIGFCSRLVLGNGKQTTIIVPFNATFDTRSIIDPEYWTNAEIIHSEIDIQSDSITITATKPKALLINLILSKLIKMKCEDVIYYISNSSILIDAMKDNQTCLEVLIEDIKLRKITTNSTFSMNASLGSIKAFIFDPTQIATSNTMKIYGKSHSLHCCSKAHRLNELLTYGTAKDMQQVLFISGPEYHDDPHNKRAKEALGPLLKMILQLPLDPSNQHHPSIAMFNLQEIRVCLDPILFRWFLYMPTMHQPKTDFVYEPLLKKSKPVSESSSAVDTPRKVGTPRESIHSSSDREPIYAAPKMTKQVKDEEVADPQEIIYNFLNKWFTVWKGLLLFGDISQCTIYFPTESLSTVGSQGIQQAIEVAMSSKDSPDILIITLPNAKIRNATNKQAVTKHFKSLPIKLPQLFWSPDKSNFPWNISISDLSCYSWQRGRKLDFLKPVSLNATVGLSTKSKMENSNESLRTTSLTEMGPNTSSQSFFSATSCFKGCLTTLGICIHIDTTPTNIILSEMQVSLLASILHAFYEVSNNLTPDTVDDSQKPNEQLPVINAQSSASPTIILKESTIDSISEQSPHLAINTDEIDNENIKLTAWIQWTVTKFSVEMLSYKMEDFISDNFSYDKPPNLKLVIEAEDLVSSLDFQSVYLKIKSKMGSASIQHYFWDVKKNEWNPGPFLGFIMKTREENTSNDKHEDNTFANIVITRASCQHTHNLWGTSKKSKSKDTTKTEDVLSAASQSRFITEIVLTLQPIDFLLSILTLRSFYMIFEPFLQLPSSTRQTQLSSISPSVIYSKTLPLAHIECKGFRFIVPSVELGKLHSGPDVFIFQLENISLTPDPVNPICRTPLRPDIYQQAARARILNVPGSEIEDRQYELNITGISLTTSTWEEFDPILNMKSSTVSHLKTMTENPALEWNLGKVTSANTTIYSYLRLLTTPAIIHKNEVICGHSVEINFVSNIDLQVSLNQIKLVSALQEELNAAFDIIMSDANMSKRPKLNLSYITIGGVKQDIDDVSTQDGVDIFRDSGFETSDLRSSISLKTKESTNIRKLSESDKSSNIFSRSTPSISVNVAFIPMDVLVTAGKISFNLYDEEDKIRGIRSKFNFKKYKPFLRDIDRETGYEGSEEGSIDEKYETKSKSYQPLQLGKKVQISCFDISFKVSNFNTIKSIPTEKNYVLNLIETRSGPPNPTTGVPPAFFTLKWSKGIGKPNLDIEIAKPTKFNISVSAWVTTHGIPRLLLNPWTISVEVCLFWESWQSIDSDPQIQISAESDCIMLDISPEQLKCIELMQKEITEFVDNISPGGSKFKEPVIDVPPKMPPSDKEQHYKDDLRAGAFHFVDSTSNNIDELPLPYQVMFWNKNISAMAWRYPQPRALTKIRVFPVPFKISQDSCDDQKVLCHLEYWSDCHGCYQPYTQFYLSESEVCHLDLPQNNNRPAVACTWRVVLTSPSDQLENQYSYKRVLLSSRALAGCIRVDSYFNKVLIPELTLAVQISKISVALYNHIDKSLPVTTPECLNRFISDLAFPDDQCFMNLTLNNLRAYLATWNFETIAFDVTTITKCDILDCAFLTLQPLIEPFAFKLEISLSNMVNVNFISKPIHFKFGASAAHTLAVSEQMWSESYRPKGDQPTTNLTIMTHYVICNDTNVNLRFGQAGYEDIFLPTKHCHLYSWRSQKCKQMIRVALEEFHWIWSEAFRIDTDGTEIYKITDENNVMIVVTVTSLSATQKQVVFSGQLVICNTLSEHFEMKVVEAVEVDKDKMFKNAPTQIVNGKFVPPSILINSTKKYFLRLRFYGLESAWSGDIPLVENMKCAQPWLVKVPLQERGQFLSIWCRIVTQTFPKGVKILAILSPLFMIRSNLPVNSKVHIETPTLNVHLESTIRGKGEFQQLYCPGTIDHSHQLSFQLDDTPTSNPYVPLNYSLVDQKKFFKKPDQQDINEILASLSKSNQSAWPYFGEEYEGIDFLIEDQPLTHVQVRYQSASEHSSALLVELLPWCLLLNTLGCPIAVIINEKELCRVNHHGICTPPKLEETFYLGVGIGGTWNLTSPLQLAKSDWSQSFYMPKITGTIPINGSIKTLVKCDPYICMVFLCSSIVNEIRLLKVSSTHVLTNYSSIQLNGICFAVPDNGTQYNIPKDVDKHSFAIMPNLNKSNAGISIMEWLLVVKNVDPNTEYVLYISFSASSTSSWSCPVQVDKNFTRRSIAIQQDKKSVNIYDYFRNFNKELNALFLQIPLVLVSQEYKGQIYLSLHHDLHPQLMIENKCGVKLFCAQFSEEKPVSIINDCKHLKWLCSIDNESISYYTMPDLCGKFLETLQCSNSENIAFASDPEGDPQGFQWSNPVNITNYNDQFVRIPYFGDVKISVDSSAHAVNVLIESVSKVEISARDIRVRLSMHENETGSSILNRSITEYPQDVRYIRTDIKDNESQESTESQYYSATESGESFTPAIMNRNLVHRPHTLPTLAENTQPDLDLINSLSSSDIEIAKEALLEANVRKEWSDFKLSVFLNSFVVTITSDLENGGAEKTEVLAVICNNIALSVNRSEIMDVLFSISDVQVDNQLHFRGSYDFPVVLIGQEVSPIQHLHSLNIPTNRLIKNARAKALITIECNFEIWNDTIQEKIVTDMTDITMNIKPLSAYVEDTYVTKLLDCVNVLVPTKLVIIPPHKRSIHFSLNSTLVGIPDSILFESPVMAKPLVLKSFVIEDLSVLLSVHSSIKLYIALDQSPLQFAKFEQKKLMTTPFRLGHAITMHYLSSAIFGAGWVVGSLELLGSPGGLARAMGSGLRDFVSLPYRGLIEGPWAFLVGITHGSASLMKHITAGTLQSVTKLASSVARNLDRLTLDEEHLRRTEEQRRQRPQGLTQGFLQGLTGLGISLLGAVGGIAHHPLQSVLSDGASPRSLVAGVGLGLVGVFTKPLSGAADLVALTGQGFLQGAGWNILPEARMKPTLNHMYSSSNSITKYSWKFIQPLTKSTTILFATEATAITNFGNYEAVALVLTSTALLVINTDEDMTQKILKLTELSGVDNSSDPTLLTLKLTSLKPQTTKVRDDDEGAVELDPASRARIADYVKNTVGLMIASENQSSEHSEISISPDQSADESNDEYQREQTTLTFYVSPHNRNYFLCLLSLLKQDYETYSFPVL
ncbi:vacuolar protein sorting-associated protein 13b [Holotrichia oblita]|uniref:Vacuolar protein sorting-associated protein 13b n=1 Tax=Holotrichia oblita TaxID=644536 RepID=A0ACB9T5F2_HOLOL|nr:vacuolar protein sorting-associated protein 13b [Holotrichia oblita]